jgi:hypothetical protein
VCWNQRKYLRTFHHHWHSSRTWLLRSAAVINADTGAQVFLRSADASFVTGHVLIVDSGFSTAGLTAWTADFLSNPKSSN